MMLALRMGRTLDELFQTMSAQEFSLWAAMYGDDQWGEKYTEMRADFRAGTIAAAVGNFAGKALKKGTSLGPADFMPSLVVEKAHEPVSSPDPLAFFSAVASRMKTKG